MRRGFEQEGGRIEAGQSVDRVITSWRVDWAVMTRRSRASSVYSRLSRQNRNPNVQMKNLPLAFLSLVVVPVVASATSGPQM